MFWKKRKWNYEPPLPPLTKPFADMTKQEAQDYFDWYLGIREERRAYLSRLSGVCLDYSPQSLVPLWSWFLKHAQIEYLPRDQLAKLRQSLESAGNPLTESILKDSQTQLSFQTELLALDISTYFGEMFVRSHTELYWDFYTRPKRDMFVNQPVVMGFPNEVDPQKPGIPLPPHHLVRMRACRILRGNAGQRDLLDIYEIWARKME